MVRAVGIDPGTYSMDIYGFDDKTGETIIDTSILREEITKNPELVLRELEKLKDVDIVVGPSGYGVPLRESKDITDIDIAYATFITEKDYERRLRIVGLRKLMKILKNSNLKVYYCPGVIHLKTVPKYRKLNKIDMGTADKIFSVVAAMRDEYERGVKPRDISIIVVEIGFAYNAVIAVQNGEIVDGIGGTYSTISYLGMGAMDSEVAYAIANVVDDFSKILLFKGGVAYLVFEDPFKHTVEEFIERVKVSENGKIAYEAFIEGILKDIARILVSVDKVDRIYLSGRFIRVEEFRKDLEYRIRKMLNKFNIRCEICTISRRAKNAKEAAEGAAIIGNGLAGGKYSELIETLKLNESSGTIFDYLIIDSDIKSRILEKFAKVPI